MRKPWESAALETVARFLETTIAGKLTPTCHSVEIYLKDQNGKEAAGIVYLYEQAESQRVFKEHNTTPRRKQMN